MSVVEVDGIEGMRALVGKEVGPSRWRTVSQADIDTFAELSGDHQWIHVDAERAAKESPYGTTIAHGNLTLAMVDGFRDELISSTGFALGVNYGWNKIRFPAPVPVDSKVRARAEIVSLEEVGGGWHQAVTRFTIEVEGADKPCFVGESVTPTPNTPLLGLPGGTLGPSRCASPSQPAIRTGSHGLVRESCLAEPWVRCFSIPRFLIRAERE